MNELKLIQEAEFSELVLIQCLFSKYFFPF